MSAGYTQFCKIISAVFLPFVVPFYGVLLVLFGDTVMAGIPTQLKWYFVAVVALCICVVPAMTVLVLNHFGYVKLMLNDRRERLFPMLVTALCYGVCLSMLWNVSVAFLIRKMLWAGLSAITVCLIVTQFWKISMHTTAMGGITAVIMLLNFSGFGHLTGALVACILISGLVASARLYLGCHTAAQVTAGFFCGFVVAALAFLLIN